MERFETALLLAGGKSSRMGFDKQLITLDGRMMVDTTITSLKLQFKEVIVVTNKSELYSEGDVLLIQDEIPDKGPLGGIYSGLKFSSSEYLYVLACDMPNINFDYIRYMKTRIGRNKYDACVTKKGDWIEPFNAFYSINLVDEIKRHLEKNQRTIYKFLKDLNCLYIEEDEAKTFSLDWSMFNNINTTGELDILRGNK